VRWMRAKERIRVGELMRGIVGTGVVRELAEVEGGGGDR